MSRDDNKPKSEPPKRRVYESPTVTSEETFEREAVLGCGKMTGSPLLPCVITPKAS